MSQWALIVEVKSLKIDAEARTSNSNAIIKAKRSIFVSLSQTSMPFNYPMVKNTKQTSYSLQVIWSFHLCKRNDG